MTPYDQVLAFGTGYLYGLRDNEQDAAGVDTWMTFGDYDLNLCGQDFASEAPTDGLIIYVYPGGWTDQLPDHLFTVQVKAVNQATFTV